MDNKLLLPCDVSAVSDGYHTFDELYTHRTALWALILTCNKEIAFKTKLNDMGEQLGGWFIAGLNTGHGQLTYHLPDSLWDTLDVREVERNADYDGHTSADVIERIKLLIADGKEKNF